MNKQDIFDKAAGGVTGEIHLALEAKRPIPRRDIHRWVTKLRAAADELETLTKRPKK